MVPLRVDVVMVEFTMSPLTPRRRPEPVENPSVDAVSDEVVATDPVRVE